MRAVIEPVRTAIVSVLAAFAAAPAAAEIVARQIVEQEIASVGADGREVLVRAPAEKVAPGEEVIYSLSYENRRDSPAENVVLVMPAPKEIAFVEGSATGEEASLAFSADGGETFVARGRLTVREDGMERPAQSVDITHVRWTISRIEPGAVGVVSYRGVVR